MAYNGLGLFVRLYNWGNDAAAGVKIRADRSDGELDGIATGLSTAICKDGQTTITANLPMATFRHTGVGNGAARDDYASLGQLQDSSVGWIVAGGTANAITASYSPAVTTLIDGMALRFRATAANTVSNPTFAPNGLPARTIVKNGGQVLAVNDIPGNLAECTLVYNLANTRWELTDPAGESVTSFTPAITFGGGNTGITYTAQVGRCSQKGRSVTVQIYIKLSSKGSSTGTALVTGLPFTSTSATNAYANLPVSGAVMASIVGQLQAYIAPSGTSINLNYLGTGTATVLDNTNFTNTTELIISGSYEASDP